LTTKTAGQQDSARRFTAVTVFRKQPDGDWKALIDNSLGPLVLGPE
jgi:ketosteroid isomerase-like protein